MNPVTVDEFKKQVWDVEGIKIEVTPRKGNDMANRLVKPYTFERLPDTATVDDLNKRLNWCLNSVDEITVNMTI